LEKRRFFEKRGFYSEWLVELSGLELGTRSIGIRRWGLAALPKVPCSMRA